MATANETTTSTEGSSATVAGNRLDQMADLLLGDEPSGNDVKDEASQLAELFDGSKDEDESLGDETDESTSNAEEDDAEEDATSNDVTWAKALGLDDKHVVLNEEGDFTGVNVKVDGIVQTVDLPTLIAGYQTTKDYTQKMQRFSQERQLFENAKSEVAQDYDKRLSAVDKLAAHLQEKIVGEFKNINWDQLRITNPGEYAALVQDYQMRQGELQQIFSAVNEERSTNESKKTQAAQALSQEYLQKQASKLIENNPEWADTNKLKADFDGFQSFIGEAYGFTPDEFANINDARMIEVLKDAKRYRDSLKIDTKKVVKQIPKFQKSNGKETKQVTKLESLIKQAKTAKGAQKRDAQTNAIAALLTGG